jgi:Pentapeptide repeats (8 copies)
MTQEFEVAQSSIQLESNFPKIFQNLDNDTVNALIIQYKSGQKDFRGIDLNGLDLSGINMSHADLRGANFFNCELRCANLEGADLREANFKDANLKAASLNNCDLSNANLTDTQLGLAILNGANLTQALWVRVNCHRTSLTGATLPDGSKWLFKTLASGKELSLEELLTQNQQAFSRRKGLASLGMLVVLVAGFELIRLVVPIVFLFWR